MKKNTANKQDRFYFIERLEYVEVMSDRALLTLKILQQRNVNNALLIKRPFTFVFEKGCSYGKKWRSFYN